MLKIHTLHALKDNFVYMIEGPGRQCAVVDPGAAEPVLAFVRERGLRVSLILCTHHHWDHVNGVAALLATTPGVFVATSRYDFDLRRVPGCNLALSENASLDLWGTEVRILETPGHTLGGIAYYFAQEQALFTGDTLFSVGCGRLFEGSAEQMFTSLQKIKALPPGLRIYFGHEYTLHNLDFVLSRAPSTAGVPEYRARVAAQLASGGDSTPCVLGEELVVNPFLGAVKVEEFAEWREARNHW